MTTTRNASLATGLVAAVALAACGGSTTPAPSAAASSAGPLASLPAASAAASPGAGGSSASGASVFGSAADRLDTLTSYRFTVNIDSTSATRTQKVVMSGTVVNTPTRSYALEMDSSGEKTSVVVIGGDAWVKLGAAPWQQLSETTAQAFITGLAALRPEKLFATAFGTNGDKFTSAGDDNRNGVASVHYKGSDALSAVFGGLFGVQATYASDAWIAKDGGYLVASEIRTTGSAASASGSYASIVNITNVNDPANRVDRPA